jgi:hypothetical protein
MDSDRLLTLLGEVKALAQEYQEITRRPLGVTAEIAEYEAGRLLGVKLPPDKPDMTPHARLVTAGSSSR